MFPYIFPRVQFRISILYLPLQNGVIELNDETYWFYFVSIRTPNCLSNHDLMLLRFHSKFSDNNLNVQKYNHFVLYSNVNPEKLMLIFSLKWHITTNWYRIENSLPFQNIIDTLRTTTK